MKKINILWLASALWLTSCQVPQQPNEKDLGHERLLMATLYQQSAAETDALYYQAFNLAEIMIRNELSKPMNDKRAIITDIDETCLDNSPYQARCILDDISYPEKWDEWCNLADAKAYPGSQRFFNFVADQGIEIFYITNRKEHLKEPTLLNMSRMGFPNADESHILMRQEDNSKESRRKLVTDQYRVVMLLGDDLEDYNNIFEGKSPLERKDYVNRLKSSFGRQFIVFPNPMYGSWEQAIYRLYQDTTSLSREQMLRETLEGF